MPYFLSLSQKKKNRSDVNLLSIFKFYLVLKLWKDTPFKTLCFVIMKHFRMLLIIKKLWNYSSHLNFYGNKYKKKSFPLCYTYYTYTYLSTGFILNTTITQSSLKKVSLLIIWNTHHNKTRNSILLYEFVKFGVSKRFWHYNFPFSRSLQVWKMRIEWQFCHLRRSWGGKSVMRFSIFQTRWCRENGNS